MTQKHFPFILVLMFASLAQSATAQEAPSYARQVRPFFVKYCSECHNAKTFKAGLDLETYKALLEGSDRGPVVMAGRPDESPLVLLAEGKKRPRMPPKKAKRHPKPAEVALLRAWVAAGAKDDSTAVKVAIPDIKPRGARAAPVAALAYHPNGFLAIGQYQAVDLIHIPTNVATGQTRLSGMPGAVTSLVFSQDGARLAVASGNPGMAGEVLLFSVPASQATWLKDRVIPAHKDVILDMAFSPDGKILATAGYDTTIKFWETANGKELRTLKEHSDSVYGASFSKDGRLLASGAADRAVKIWEVASGKLLYTFGEPTDWVYAVAWSPDGKHLAAAGVDKSIRVWETGAEKGKLIHSVFAHEGPITRLVYDANGKTLYSLGEDRIIKAWDAERMVERKVFDRQPEVPLALAVRPDGKQLAVGRYDGAVILLDTATGKVNKQVDLVNPPSPKKTEGGQAKANQPKPLPPQATKVTPAWGQRGKTVRVVFEGKNLDPISSLTANYAGATARIISQGKASTTLPAEITFPATTPAGVYQLTLHNAAGKSTLAFTVDLFSQVNEREPNDSPGTGQNVTLPATVVGTIGKAGDVDFYRFDVKKGQQVGVQVLTAAIGSKLDALLQLTDATGKVLAQTSEGILGYTFAEAGTYALGIRDGEFRGGLDKNYRLHIGDIPIITSVFPLGIQRGTEAEILVDGVHLGGLAAAGKVRVKAPAGAALGARLPITVAAPLGPPLGSKSIVVGEFAEVSAPLSAPPAGSVAGQVPVPGTANGMVRVAGQTDIWRFQAKKNQRLIVEVHARRLGTPLDSFIEIRDTQNRPVARATLRSLAKTYVTFRDHDSASAGIRIEAWDELAVNDYLYVGSELLRIQELPPNPDADCVFVSARGQRLGMLDTTPTHHSMGTPMYKVEIHPPGTQFPANGYPVITLYYRNDDGGPGIGRDSRLFFDPPADGEYRVRIGDSRGQAGNNYAYRLTVRPPRPNFNVSFNPTNPVVSKGSALPITVSTERLDGYEGEIAVRLENVPAGFSAPATTIPAGENSTVFALYADRKAMNPGNAKPLNLVAQAKIDGKDVIKEVAGGLPKLIEPGDIVTTTEQSEVTVKPGGQVRLTVNIDRQKGFKGRVPVDVKGLPHGVRVLDIGLNGILITEKEARRTIVVYAEPWVQPTTHPFVVLAKSEGKNTEHAARSVLLRVAGSTK